MRARGQRVRNWRVLTAIAAVVLAALAGVLVWKYTDDAENNAKNKFAFVSVLIAKSRVPANTSFERAIDAEMIVREQCVSEGLPGSRIDADKPGGGAKTDAELKK